jgi:hypothetical protein
VSLQHALLFLRDVRQDAGLRVELKCRHLALDLPALVALGAGRGWQFGVDELRVAFSLDWKLRAAHLSACADNSGSRPA